MGGHNLKKAASPFVRNTSTCDRSRLAPAPNAAEAAFVCRSMVPETTESASPSQACVRPPASTGYRLAKYCGAHKGDGGPGRREGGSEGQFVFQRCRTWMVLRGRNVPLRGTALLWGKGEGYEGNTG